MVQSLLQKTEEMQHLQQSTKESARAKAGLEADLTEAKAKLEALEKDCKYWKDQATEGAHQLAEELGMIEKDMHNIADERDRALGDLEAAKKEQIGILASMEGELIVAKEEKDKAREEARKKENQMQEIRAVLAEKEKAVQEKMGNFEVERAKWKETVLDTENRLQAKIEELRETLKQKEEELAQKGQGGNNGGDEDLAKEFDEMRRMMDSKEEEMNELVVKFSALIDKNTKLEQSFSSLQAKIRRQERQIQSLTTQTSETQQTQPVSQPQQQPLKSAIKQPQPVSLPQKQQQTQPITTSKRARETEVASKENVPTSPGHKKARFGAPMEDKENAVVARALLGDIKGTENVSTATTRKRPLLQVMEDKQDRQVESSSISAVGMKKTRLQLTPSVEDKENRENVDPAFFASSSMMGASKLKQPSAATMAAAPKRKLPRKSISNSAIKCLQNAEGDFFSNLQL